MRKLSLLMVAGALLEPVTSYAATPDLLSLSLGYANFDKTESHRKSADMRLEYRWGLSLLPQISTSFKGFDRYMQFHPFAGVETSSLGVLYGLGGFAADIPLPGSFVLTWSEGAGLYYPGYSARMGSALEFRSQGELGWNFESGMRASFYVSHISNAKITEWNPGSEIAGFYLHIPLSKVAAAPRSASFKTAPSYQPWYNHER